MTLKLKTYHRKDYVKK